MSDIQLVFGVDSPNTATSIQSELNEIIKNLNLNGIKLDNVEIELSSVSTNNFKKALDDLTTYAQNEAAKIQAAYSNITVPPVPNGGGGGNGGKRKVSHELITGIDTADYNNALAKIQEAYAKIKKLQQTYPIDNTGATAHVHSQLATAKATLEKLEADLKSASLYADDFAKEMDLVGARTKQASAELKTIDGLNPTKKLVPGTADYNNALAQANSLLGEVTAAYNKWTAAADGDTSDAYNNLLNIADAIQDIIDKIKDGSIKTKADFKDKISAAKSEFLGNSAEIKAKGKDKLSLKDQWSKVTEDLVKLVSIKEAIHAASEAVKEMVNNVVELDTAMTELKKVTDETDATYDRFLTNAASRAKEVGATLTDVVTATADFARLGYSIDEASTLADTAIVYKNVADGISDISEASESIISTMKAFGIEAENSITIADKYNEVDILAS